MVGERLMELRKDKGLSREELGAELLLSKHTIESYELNKSEPNDETKVKIAKRFNISLDYLLGVTDEELALDRGYDISLPRKLSRQDVEKVKDYVRLISRELK